MYREYWPFTESYTESISFYDSVELYKFQFEFADSIEAKMFVLYWFQAEVLNGGLVQFFDNSTGLIAPEVVDALRSVGLNKLSEKLGSAIQLFGNTYELNRVKRKKILSRIEGALDSLDDAVVELLYEENGGLENAARTYVTANTC